MNYRVKLCKILHNYMTVIDIQDMQNETISHESFDGKIEKRKAGSFKSFINALSFPFVILFINLFRLCNGVGILGQGSKCSTRTWCLHRQSPKEWKKF